MFAKNKNHRSFIILSFISLAFLMNLGVSFAQSTPTVELTIHASDGFWSVYAADSTGNNAGIEDYDLDVVASGGISLLSCRNQTPTGTDDIGAADGFGLLTSNGNVSGGSVLGITGAQAAIYDSSTNNLVEDQAVIQGFGQVASSSLMNNPWNVSWSQPALIASGSYEGISGSLTVKSDPTAITGFQCLDIVQNGQWAGPGNVENANVISASAQIEQSEHAPFTLTYSEAAVGAVPLGKEVFEPDQKPYNFVTYTESSPVPDGFLHYTGIAIGDMVDVLVKLGLDKGSGDPATNSANLRTILNLINDNNNDGPGGSTDLNLASAIPASLNSEYPGYDLLLSIPATAGAPYVNLDFANLSSSLSDLGIAQIGITGTSVVPEPASVSLWLLSSVVLLSRRRERRPSAS